MLNPTDITTVFNQCRVELTGVSDALLKSALFEVLDEFFRDTSSWRETVVFAVAPPAIDPTTPVGWDQALSYPVAVPEGQIIRLDGVVNANGSYVAATMPHVGTIRLRNKPNAPQQYTACLVANVSLPMTREGHPIAPEWVLRKWHLGVKEGLLGTLMNMKNKSFSDAKGALYHLQKFRQFIQNVRTAVLRANTTGATAWRFPQQFRAISQKGGVPSFANGNDWSG